MPSLLSQPGSMRFAASLRFADNMLLGIFWQYLVAAGLYESRDEALLREEVLGFLDEVRSLLNVPSCAFMWPCLFTTTRVSSEFRNEF